VLPDEPVNHPTISERSRNRVPSVKKSGWTWPCDPSSRPRAHQAADACRDAVPQAALEVEHPLPIAERYEEINLLYTIGRFLGRT